MKHITSKLLSLLLCLAMLMSMVPVAYADDTESNGKVEDVTTYSAKMDLDAFIKAVVQSNYTYDGNGVTVTWGPESGCFEMLNDGSNHGLGENCPNANATGNTPNRVNAGFAQYQLFGGVNAPVTIKNVHFAYTPGEFKTCSNSAWATVSSALIPAELQFENTGDLTITGCTFDGVSLAAYGDMTSPAGKYIVSGCTFMNMTDSEAKYAIHYLRGSEVYVSNNTFTNVLRGMLLQAPNGQKAYFSGNNFSGVTDKAIKVYQTAADTEIVLSGNTTGMTLDLAQDDLTNVHCGSSDNINISGTGSGMVEVKADATNVTVGEDGTISATLDSGTTTTAVARTADGQEYTTLKAALAAVTEDNALTEVTEEAWPSAKPVYYNGNFYAGTSEVITGKGALEHAIDAANNANGDEIANIYVRPNYNANGGTSEALVKQAHQPILTSIAIYGNNASLGYADGKGWEPCIELPSNRTDAGAHQLTKDISAAIYNLHDGAAFWGTRATDKKVDLTMVNCNNAHEIMFYGSGTGAQGATNITVKHCTFDLTSKSASEDHNVIVSIGAGDITVENSTFKAANINIKNVEGGNNTITVKNTQFTDTVSGNQNIRIRGFKANTTISTTIENVSFAGESSQNIEIGENSEGKINYNISGTNGTMNVYKQRAAEPTTEALDGSTVTGSNAATAVGNGSEANPYTLEQLGAMTRADYIAAQKALSGTMYVTVGDYSYGTNGTLGNGERNDTPGQTPDHSKLNAYGENGYLDDKNDGANGKSIVFVNGSITSGATGYTSIDNIGTSLLLAVPAYTNVTFQNITFKNVMSFDYQLYTSPWSQLGELKFDGCTFNGIIVGAIAAQTLTFTGCTFTDYTNSTSANNSNPTWIRPAYGNWTKGDNEGQGGDFRSLTTINFTGNKVTSTRPVKFERIAQWEMPTTVKVTDNTFKISKQDGDTSTKNVGLYFGANAKFDLVAASNTKSDDTAALYTAVYSAPNGVSYPGLPAGSTVKDSQGNEANLDALKWKAPNTAKDTLTLTTTKEVASMTNTKGTVNFATLQEAIDAAARNATVKLLADTKENVTISTPYVTLDLNGHTLNGSTGERKPALTITARVTVKDSSEGQTGTIMREDTAENSGVSSHYVIDVQGSGWLTFESGTVKNDSGAGGTKGASLVRVGDDSVAKYPGLNIKGGTFTQDNFIVIKVDRGDLFLNGGALNSANSYAVQNWLRATIKGGTVNGNISSWTYEGSPGAQTTISGGTVNGNVEAISYDGKAGKPALVSISGGTVNGTLMTGIYGSATEPSKDMATIEVTGGTFSKDPSKYLVEGSTATQNDDGTFGVAKAYLAKVGENSYYTMDEAFKAQTTSREPIVLLRDYTTGGTFNSGSINRTVDLNGHTWTCTGTDANSAAFEINYADASLTVKNGKIVSSQLVGLIPSASHGTITYDNSNLVFESVEMSTTATSGIETNGNNTNDSVTLKNSTLNVPNGFGIYFPSSGTLTIDNSTINAKTMGVQVCAGSLSINAGSTITVSGDAVPKIEGDGAIQDGAAISIVNRTGYKGLGKIEVTGGTFTAKRGNAAIKAYDWQNQTESNFTESDKVSVSGGTFSSAVSEDLCAEGYVPTENENGTYGVKAGTPVAVVNGFQYYSLEKAIAAAKDSDTVTLLADATEDVTINKNITLDLGGKTLTNTSTGKATISVTGGTVTVKNGNVIGGTSYYNIEVTKGSNANLTLEGVTATAGNTGSSMIDNWGTLTITSGTYTGGLNVVKSEEGSTLTIKGGTFTLEYATSGYTGVIFAYGTTTISGGEFIQNLTTTGRWNHPQVIATGMVEGYPAITKITGGKFTNKMSGEGIFRGVGKGTSDNFEVSGGTFNKSVSEAYCADGFIPTKNADGTYGVKEGKYVAQISSKKYETLADAIRLATNGKTIKLLADVSEDVTIGKKITLDLNGKTLTNKADHTITVIAGASLTITGEGTVDNVTHAKAAIVNYGTVVLKGGTYTRSQENAENNKDSAGGNSYYTILNDKGGHMTINAGVTVTNVGHFSSMIRNGGDENSTKKSTLIINGGTFSGGINTVKNDVFGVLEIKGGNFSNTSQYVVMNWNEAAISGGTFEANATAKAVLFTAAYLEDRAVGELTVTGGTFKTTSDAQALIDDTYGANYVGTAAISGGSFNKQVEQKWCALGFVPEDNGNGTYGVKAAEGNAAMFDAEGKLIGYADVEVALKKSEAKTVKLIKDAVLDNTVILKNKTLDLNGNKLTLSDDAMVITATNGFVIDSQDGKGIIIAARESLGATVTKLASKQVPLYDDGVLGEEHGYRFYNVTMYSNVSEKTATSAKFWCSPDFDNYDAYLLLASGKSGAQLYVMAEWSGKSGEYKLKFQQSLINQFCNNKKTDKYAALYVKFTGLDQSNMSGTDAGGTIEGSVTATLYFASADTNIWTASSEIDLK